MKSETRRSYETRLCDLLTYVLEHLDEPLQLDVMAERACFSSYHFHRIFRGMVGETLGDFVRRMRLERAAYRLGSTNQSVSEIALDAGFGSHEGFIKAFRAVYFVPPSRYRKQGQLVYRIGAPSGVHYQPNGVPPRPILKSDGGTKMNVEIKSLPVMRALAIRHIGPYNQIGPAFNQLFEYVQANNIPMGAAIGVFHDNPETVAASELRSDAAMVVDAAFAAVADPFHLLEIPAATYAVATHIGPYEDLGEAWTRFMGEWFPASGHEVGEGVCFEMYMSDCSNVPPDQLRTDLYEPIKDSAKV